MVPQPPGNRRRVVIGAKPLGEHSTSCVLDTDPAIDNRVTAFRYLPRIIPIWIGTFKLRS
jgi:hypothetical protein